MKRLTLLLAIAVLTLTLNVSAQTKRALKKNIELKMPKTVDDDMPGTRGASVAWHPIQKKYYAVFAGNAGYPLAVFNATAKRLSEDDLTAVIDTRGLWYNPKTKKIAGNGYNEGGWFSYKLDSKGIPTDVTVDFEGMNQPEDQCVGVLDPLKNEVLFLNKKAIAFYTSTATASEKTLTIHFGITKKNKADEVVDEESEETPEAYNNRSIVYTGVKGSEIGLLNTYEKQIELYNIADGYLTSVLKLPEDAPVESTFNFAYANSIYWLFDIENRTWKGYR